MLKVDSSKIIPDLNYIQLSRTFSYVEDFAEVPKKYIWWSTLFKQHVTPTYSLTVNSVTDMFEKVFRTAVFQEQILSRSRSEYMLSQAKYSFENSCVFKINIVFLITV